jgi:hypothetical protein
MEVQHHSGSDHQAEAERRAAIVGLWRELGAPAVDAHLLKAIRSRLSASFGANVIDGPAAIARILADEGAELNHPEIIETDVEWRQARIEDSAKETGLEQLSSAEVLTLVTAEKLINELEAVRKRSELKEDRERVTEVRKIASESRRLAESIARNRSAEKSVRVEQAEIVEWLKVWLQTPALFKDWLELRKRSDEFRARFSVLNH